MSDAEGVIAEHVVSAQRALIISSTPLCLNGGALPGRIRLEAVDDFGWSYDRAIDNF